MYNAKFINSQNGKTFYFGYKYGNIFDIDPLDGVEIDISTSQGFQQTGVTIENRSIGGLSRQIKGKIIGEATSVKKEMMQVFSPMASGRLYFNDSYYCDAVVKSAPAFSVEKKNATFVIGLYCPYPYWYNITEHGYLVGGYTPSFRFPVNYSVPHKFGERNPSAFINCYNDGVVDTPFTATFTTTAAVENYGIIDALTLKELRINDTLNIGEKTTVRRENGRLYVEKTADGVVSNIFSALDEDSELMYFIPGDNLIKSTADSGADDLVVSIAFYSAFEGVFDGM